MYTPATGRGPSNVHVIVSMGPKQGPLMEMAVPPSTFPSRGEILSGAKVEVKINEQG